MGSLRNTVSQDTALGGISSRPTIGLLIGRLGDQRYQAQVWPGVADAAKAGDANLICFVGGALDGPQEFDTQRNAIYDLVDQANVDGLVTMSGSLGLFIGPERLLQFYRRYTPLPMVSIAVELEGIPSVLVDNQSGIRDAITHLIKVHRLERIAFIRGPETNPEAEERFQAYTRVLQEHGLQPDPRLIAPGNFLSPSGAEAIHRMLDTENQNLQAVVAANDEMALGALSALRERGVQVPEEIAVIGFDDLEEARFAAPPLTTSRQPLYGQGKRAAEMLLDLLAGRKVPERVILPTELVIRRSCGCMEIPQHGPEVVRSPRENKKTANRRAVSRRVVLARLVQSAGQTAAELEPGWADRLLDACEATRREGRRDVFLPIWDEILRQVGAAGGDVMQWHDVLNVLCRHALQPAPAGKQAKRVEAIEQNARSLIGGISQWAQAFRRKQAERHAFEFTAQISEPLMTAFDLDELTNVIAQQLPQMGIQGCFLSLYEPAPDGDTGFPSSWSRLILAYDSRGRVDLESGGRRFLSKELVPAGILPTEQRFAILLEPLHFRDEDQLGFIAFTPLRPEAGILREALSRLISTALKGALLLQEQKKTEETLRRREESQHAFAERLTRVLEMINKLSKIESFDDLCRRSVELALERLGFDRIGLCFLSEDNRTVLGAYGTDENGRLRDERHLQRPLRNSPTIRKLLENTDPVLFFEQEILLDDHLAQVGVGNHAIARLWNGEQIIGFFAVDNLLRKVPISDEDLRILVLYGTAMGHLFTLKRAEGSLRDSESKFRVLFEQAAVGVAQMDTRTGVFLEVNQRFCAIVGRTTRELVGLTMREITQPEDYAAEQEKTILLAEGTVREYSLDKRLLRADGSSVWIDQTISTIRSPGERGDFSTMVIQDISERRQAEDAIRNYSERLEEMVDERTRELRDTQEQLIRQEKLSILGKLAGGVGHELRNPLGVISNAVYYLKMTYSGPDDTTREYLDLLSDEVRNAEKIVSDLLDFARIRSVEREKIAVSELVARFLERQPPPPNVHVSVTVGFNPPSVWVDPLQMVQVFSNLVNNAFQAMPEGGELAIRAERAGNKTLIQVADTGCGIPPENLDKIFEPLFTTRVRGIGLGLAISKSLVETNGGTITVESEPGKGTTFSVWLPAPGSD